MMKRQERGPSQRQLRVSEQLRHIIIETLQRGHFYDKILIDQSHNVMVSEVRVTPDLKHAKTYVMSVGGDYMEELLPALNEAAPLFQKEINRKLNLKFTPKVQFVIDQSFEKVKKIDEILHNLPKPREESLDAET